MRLAATLTHGHECAALALLLQATRTTALIVLMVATTAAATATSASASAAEGCSRRRRRAAPPSLGRRCISSNFLSGFPLLSCSTMVPATAAHHLLQFSLRKRQVRFRCTLYACNIKANNHATIVIRSNIKTTTRQTGSIKCPTVAAVAAATDGDAVRLDQ